MKWTVLGPYIEREGLDTVVMDEIKKATPKHETFKKIISATLVKKDGKNTVRILFETLLPEDAVQYPINRSRTRYAYITDEKVVKAIKKLMKEANEDA